MPEEDQSEPQSLMLTNKYLFPEICYFRKNKKLLNFLPIQYLYYSIIFHSWLSFPFISSKVKVLLATLIVRHKYNFQFLNV